ncbi:abscission/NoCut checkpoint regulator [Onthophagus taurus]|uniref:abscission/NoCut checkpoint regulator n=1 Tax=Onthophagus taurus TaxID=166361 RepID=UPI000C207515|nr:abscission/NoCut checkpoint regulator [Onthophagus taurus]
MSCNHCSTKFNFFHKEMGCASCNLSFCNKCLKQKCRIPSKGPGEYSVCRICHSKITSGQSTTQQNIQPPDAFIKRLEALENNHQTPVSIVKNEQDQTTKSTLSPIDQRLLERLENLKDKGTGPPPTEAELRQRLAALKGENSYVEGPSKAILANDFRTDEQKVDAYLEMFTAERDIELAQNPEEELEARLATLRGQGVRPNENSYISNLHDDSSSDSEEEVGKITKKIMAEVALDKKYELKLPCPENEEEYEEELPWCVLCNKDAKYRCIDCGGDLYCQKCNLELHSSWDGTAHRIIKYTPFK